MPKTHSLRSLVALAGLSLAAFKRLQRRLAERTPRRLDVAA